MLRLDEIEPGVVAYFDTSILLSDPRVRHSAARVFRNGPFVCIEVGPGSTSWLEITSKPGRFNQRMPSLSHWKLHGSDTWRAIPAFLNYVREPFAGRDVAFCDATRFEHTFTQFLRPRISDEGVAAIVCEMQRRNGLTA